MDPDDLTGNVADVERAYREAIAPALTELRAAAEDLLLAARRAEDQGANLGTDDDVKDAAAVMQERLDAAVATIAAERGKRTKALKATLRAAR